MNYSRLLISILSLLPLASSANIVHMQKWRHKETGQVVILAGDMHVVGVHEKQATDLKKLIDSGFKPIIELPENEDRKAEILLVWAHNYCKNNAVQGYVPAEIRPQSYWASFRIINALLCENQELTEQDVQKGWQLLGFNFHRSRSALCEELRKFVSLVQAKKNNQEQFIQYVDAIGEAYNALRKESSRLKALLNPQFNDLPDEEYDTLFAELYRNNFIAGEKDGQIMLNTQSLQHMLDKAMNALVELNFLFHLTETSPSRVLVLCGDRHVRNMHEKMVELGYVLENTADSQHVNDGSLKSTKEIFFQNIDEYCIDIAQFLAD